MQGGKKGANQQHDGITRGYRITYIIDPSAWLCGRICYSKIGTFSKSKGIRIWVEFTWHTDICPSAQLVDYLPAQDEDENFSKNGNLLTVSAVCALRPNLKIKKGNFQGLLTFQTKNFILQKQLLQLNLMILYLPPCRDNQMQDQEHSKT